MPTEITCPACELSDQVEKVSTLYLVGTELRRKPEQPASPTGASSLNAHAAEILLAHQKAYPGVEPLQRKLTPPSSGRPSATRPIHPDLAVLAFSLIVPVFLYGILTSQPSMLIVVLAVLGAFYGLYFLMRRRIIARFEAEQTRRREIEQRTARAIQYWMRLYYCGREELVFDPETGESLPVDQMMGMVWQPEVGE